MWNVRTDQLASLVITMTFIRHTLLSLSMNSASRLRLERFSDKLRDLIRRDAHHLTYKMYVYGECRNRTLPRVQKLFK